jgi:hypothetical protein
MNFNVTKTVGVRNGVIISIYQPNDKPKTSPTSARWAHVQPTRSPAALRPPRAPSGKGRDRPGSLFTANRPTHGRGPYRNLLEPF